MMCLSKVFYKLPLCPLFIYPAFTASTSALPVCLGFIMILNNKIHINSTINPSRKQEMFNSQAYSFTFSSYCSAIMAGIYGVINTTHIPGPIRATQIGQNMPANRYL
jgi:hypothetical protein